MFVKKTLILGNTFYGTPGIFNYLSKKRPYDICFPLNIDQTHIESISIPYCVLECKALLTIFAQKKIYDLCFHLNNDQLQIESISIPYCGLESRAL